METTQHLGAAHSNAGQNLHILYPIQLADEDRTHLPFIAIKQSKVLLQSHLFVLSQRIA